MVIAVLEAFLNDCCVYIVKGGEGSGFVNIQTYVVKYGKLCIQENTMG